MPNRKKDYRDMDKWRATYRRQKNRYYGKTSSAPNSRKRWTDEEVQLVLRHEITDTELSKKIGRSVMAIQVKRIIVKKGKKHE